MELELKIIFDDFNDEFLREEFIRSLKKKWRKLELNKETEKMTKLLSFKKQLKLWVKTLEILIDCRINDYLVCKSHLLRE